jgi:hypothetical protein
VVVRREAWSAVELEAAVTRTPTGRHARPSLIPDSSLLRWLNGGSRLADTTGFALIGVAASLVIAGGIALTQWPVMFQPTRTAVVKMIVPTGEEIGCGKGCTCDVATIVMAVDDGALGRESDCVDYYAVGEEVELRRHRGDSMEVFVDPVPGVWLPVAGAAGAAAIGLFMLLYAALALAWDWMMDGRGSRSARRRRR